MYKGICCIFNLAPHYRTSIYKLMDSELHCDFYFGDKVDSPLKTMDHNILKGFKKIVKNKRIHNTGFIWQSNVCHLVLKPYKHYILTGSPGSLSNWVIIIMAIILRKKTYAWSHGLRDNLPVKAKLIHKTFFKLCHKVLTYGETAKKYMITEGFSETKLVPIYNSLDYQLQLKIRENLGSSEIFKLYFKNDLPVITYIGRIQKSKKIDLLIEAIKHLNEQNYPCNLVIIGKEIDGSEIADLIHELNIESLVWQYGASYEEKEIAELLHNSDVCVSPGLIGLTAIHALTYGLPVITSDDYSNHGPEFETIQKGISGDFFHKNDMEELCEKIKNWTYLNLEKREIVRQSCYKIIEDNWNPLSQINILKQTINQEK